MLFRLLKIILNLICKFIILITILYINNIYIISFICMILYILFYICSLKYYIFRNILSYLLKSILLILLFRFLLPLSGDMFVIYQQEMGLSVADQKKIIKCLGVCCVAGACVGLSYFTYKYLNTNTPPTQNISPISHTENISPTQNISPISPTQNVSPISHTENISLKYHNSEKYKLGIIKDENSHKLCEETRQNLPPLNVLQEQSRLSDIPTLVKNYSFNKNKFKLPYTYFDYFTLKYVNHDLQLPLVPKAPVQVIVPKAPVQVIASTEKKIFNPSVLEVVEPTNVKEYLNITKDSKIKLVDSINKVDHLYNVPVDIKGINGIREVRDDALLKFQIWRSLDFQDKLKYKKFLSFVIDFNLNSTFGILSTQKLKLFDLDLIILSKLITFKNLNVVKFINNIGFISFFREYFDKTVWLGIINNEVISYVVWCLEILKLDFDMDFKINYNLKDELFVVDIIQNVEHFHNIVINFDNKFKFYEFYYNLNNPPCESIDDDIIELIKFLNSI